MAISFGHKDNQWRSKYTFRPKAMMNNSRSLISKGDSTKLYKHNEGDVNRFYGTKSSSVLGVAFNDNPSSNKVFKSISLEGSDILKQRRHDFAACASTEAPNRNKYYLTSNGKNMGGIIYNTLGKSDAIVNGTSLHYLGDVTSVNDIEINEEVIPTVAQVDIDTSYSAYTPLSNQANGVKYGFYFPDTQEFYFGSDIIVDDEGDGEPGDGGGPTEEFDNCDTLELYSSSQFYEIVFYPDIGYLYLYIPNSVPVGDQTYILPEFLIDTEPASVEYVSESMDYYDQFRWSWRVFVGEPSEVNLYLSTYSGLFLDDDGNLIEEGYLEEPSNFCTFFFGFVNILEGDIDPSVACGQLSSAFSYSTTPSESDATSDVTITFAGDVLQDPEFSDQGSYIYLYHTQTETLVDYSSISYSPGQGTTILFEDVPPNLISIQSYKLYFVNGDCSQFDVDNEVYVPVNEVVTLCQDIYDNLSPILTDVYEPSVPDEGGLDDGITFSFGTQGFGQAETFRVTLATDDLYAALENAAGDGAFEFAAETDTADEVWGDPRLKNLKLTLVKDFYDVANLPSADVVQMDVINYAASDLVLMFSCEANLITDGEWSVFLDVAPCPPSLSTPPENYFYNYGFRIKDINIFRGADYCDDLFPESLSSPYAFGDFASSKTVTPGVQTSSVTFNIALTTPDLDAEDVVFILCGPFGGPQDFSSLPHDGSQPPVAYVQDGGNNFDNPESDITSTWTRTSNLLSVKVSNIPTRSPDFEFGNEDTYVNRYSFVFVSKTCYNPAEDTSIEDYYGNNSPWNDTYGIQGSVITDSDSPNLIGGVITFTYNEEDLDEGFFTPSDAQKADFNKDGAVTSADLLLFLAAFGLTTEELTSFPITITNEEGDIAYISPDIDDDGLVATSDLLQFLAVFGEGVPAQRSRLDDEDEETIPLVDLTSGSYGLSNIPSSIAPISIGSYEYTATSPSTATLGVSCLSPEIASYIKSDEFPSNAQLFAFLAPAAAGDDLRGQTAELLLDLGQEDFELFAVNLNYELLNADHTK